MVVSGVLVAVESRFAKNTLLRPDGLACTLPCWRLHPKLTAIDVVQ